MTNDEALDELTIFLVDDDQVDVRTITRSLRKCGISNPIARAVDGVEALEMIRGTNGKEKLRWPYFILLDINMPRMNGLEFLDEVRGDPVLHEVPITMLTTSDDDKDKTAAYANHVAGYLLKSDVANEFLDMISILGQFILTIRLPRKRAGEIQASAI